MQIKGSVLQAEIPPKNTGGVGREASEETLAVVREALKVADGSALVLDCETAKEASRWAARGRGTLFATNGLTSAMRGVQVFIYKNGVHAE